jgi:hypothetical protein
MIYAASVPTEASRPSLAAAASSFEVLPRATDPGLVNAYESLCNSIVPATVTRCEPS